MKERAANLFSYFKNRLPIIQQSETSECGLACLAMIASYYGKRTDIGALRRRYAVAAQGATLKHVIDISSAIGFRSRPVRFEISDIAGLQLPCILHWDLNHFVVLKSASKKSITVHDPAIGRKTYLTAEAGKHITGVALEMQPSDNYAQKSGAPPNSIRRIRISDFWTNITGIKSALAQTLLLSVVLQLFVIASPFYMQLVVDEVATKHNSDLLIVLFLGFSLLHVINLVATSLRSFVLLHAGALVSFQIVANLFRHMIRLPVSFFEKRNVGDILSRFQSTEPLRKLLVEDLVAGIIDGLMAVTTLILMFVYSPLLSWVVVAVFSLYVLVSFSLLPAYRERTKDSIIAAAKENSNFIETLSAIQPIRLFGAEDDREHSWQNIFADVINYSVRLGHIGISYGFFKTLTTSVETLVVVYLGAKLVLSAELSIGMLFAFVAWKGQFGQRTLSLIQKGLDLKMLNLHLQRLSDIVQTEKEEFFSVPVDRSCQVLGGLSAENVTLSYGEGMIPVLNGLSFRVAPGDLVAITGPSGCGKSTLIKVLSGLLKPSSGQVVVDGQILELFGVQNYRAQIAAAMQGDILLSGSILDNISFFDNKPDFGRAKECASLACIHDEIMAMPMQYQSVVGSLGSFLSGGQKQRIVLARALYRTPKILFVDEGTSHLDIALEKRLNCNLKSLEMTRILVAHRPETIQFANRVLDFENGRLVER